MLVAVMKMKKIAAILLSFALLAFLPSGQACAAAKHYEDEKYGFSFSYPENWQQYNVFFNQVMVFPPPADGIGASFIIYAYDAPFKKSAMTKESFVDDYDDVADHVEILSYKKTKLGGAPCVVADILCYTDRQQKVREKTYIVNHNGKGYMIFVTAASKDYSKFKNSFKMILDSFRFCD